MQGQGKPLPSFMEVDGQWILENHLYICRSNPGSVRKVILTPGAQRHDGTYAVGFAADQLAAALGITVDELFKANESGALIFLGVANVLPQHGGSRAHAYGFRIGSVENFLTVETSQSEGAA